MLFSLTSYAFCSGISFFNEQLYDFGFEISLYHNPVSYTHLDVYKRQAMFSVPEATILSYSL